MSHSIRKIAVIGTGAVGGLYGALLAKSGLDVSFVMRSGLEHCRKFGFQIRSIWGDFTSQNISYLSSTKEISDDTDLILIAIKSTENFNLTSILNPLHNKKISILLIQNGISQELLLHALLPHAKIFGGLAFLCSVKLGPGRIHHLDYGDLTIAESQKNEKSMGISEELLAIEKIFKSAQVPIQLEEDLILARWKKLVWNIPFNGLSVLLNAKTNELMEKKSSLQLIRGLMEEVQTAAKMEGKKIEEDFLEERIRRTALMKPYPTSMKLDYENGRRMELNSIYHSVFQRAKNSNCSLPRIQFLANALEYLEEMNLGKKINSLP